MGRGRHFRRARLGEEQDGGDCHEEADEDHPGGGARGVAGGDERVGGECDDSEIGAEQEERPVVAAGGQQAPVNDETPAEDRGGGGDGDESGEGEQVLPFDLETEGEEENRDEEFAADRGDEVFERFFVVGETAHKQTEEKRGLGAGEAETFADGAHHEHEQHDQMHAPVRGVAEDEVEEGFETRGETADEVDRDRDAGEFEDDEPAEAFFVEGGFAGEQDDGDDLEGEHQQQGAAARFVGEAGVVFPAEVAHADGAAGEGGAGDETAEPLEAGETAEGEDDGVLEQGPEAGAAQRGKKIAEFGEVDFKADLEQQQEEPDLPGLGEHLADLGVGDGGDGEAEQNEQRKGERGASDETAQVGHAHEQQDEQDDDLDGVHGGAEGWRFCGARR